MARANTVTKLPLDRWAQLMGLNPLHFNGVYPDADNQPTVCQQPWLQHAYQAVDRVGREEVAYAIAQAESDIENELGYHVLPSWVEDEWKETTRFYRPELTNIRGTDIRGYAGAVQANKGYAISGGVRAKELIEADSPVTYTDEDNDGYEETATVTATVATGQSECEVRVYMRQEDALPDGTDADDRFEIRPISVDIVGTTATITFARHQALLPEVYEDLVPVDGDSHLRGADGSNDLNFVTDVDVYRVYNDPQTQAILMWEPTGSSCGCNDSSCVLCAYTVQNACLMIRGEPRQSRLSYRPGAWDSDSLEFTSESFAVCSRQPDIVRLYYYSGWRGQNACPTRVMDGEWERAVAYYAAALLERPICECSNVRDFIAKWQAVPATSEGVVGIQHLTEFDNPFGITEGALFAWKRVARAARGAAVLA